MFKPIKITFPDGNSDEPQFIYKAVLYQKVYEHEMLVITYRDWDASYNTIKAGTPVLASIAGEKTSRTFTGYVHHIQPSVSPGKNYTDVVVIGGSFPMKQASQKVYREHTADQVVKSIAIKHGLNFIGVPHKRVFDQVSQAGYTGWQMAVRLAKQVGYTLRAQNTEVYFEPILTDYQRYRTQCPKFVLRDAQNPKGSTLYSFQPIIGESIDWDGNPKAAVAVTGVDRFSKVPVKQTPQKRTAKTRNVSQEEFFDRFESLAVTPNPEIAKFESQAAEARTAFPYRGSATVLGDPSIRPNIPVYLQGVGETYSGYWTVLGAEHIIVETERDVYTYTTNINVGSDAVGGATRWSDGSLITSPPDTPERFVSPGVSQTKKLPGSKLIKSKRKTSNRNQGSFGKIDNRKKTTSKVKLPSTWRAASPTPKIPAKPKVNKPKAVTDRIRAKVNR